MYYLRARYYDPELGRFTSIDPLGVVPNAQKPNMYYPKMQYKDGLNLYEYVKSNPVNFIDPQGLTVYFPPFVPGDAYWNRPAECSAIDGYWRHCNANCELRRFLGSLGIDGITASTISFLAASYVGGDWSWLGGGGSILDSEANVVGLVVSYIPGSCRSHCNKALKIACKLHCPASHSPCCNHVTPVTPSGP